MSVTVYKTDAIIVTDYKSMTELVEWASGEMSSGLVDKRVIVAESSFGWTVKSPSSRQKAILTLFYSLLAQSHKRNLDFVFILNHPEYLDPRIKRYVDGVRDFPSENDGGVSAATRKLSSMGAPKGGRARAEKLTPERRSEIASKAARERWARRQSRT